MVDLLGSGYVIDHCVAAYTERQRREMYEIYVTDALYSLITVWSTNAKDVMKRYYDLLHPQKEDTRTGQEIAEDIIKRHGLKAVT